MYLHTKNKVSRSTLPKIRAHTGHVDTHRHDQTHYHATFCRQKKYILSTHSQLFLFSISIFCTFTFLYPPVQLTSRLFTRYVYGSCSTDSQRSMVEWLIEATLTTKLYAGTERMLHRRRKASDVLHRHTVRVVQAQVLVQYCKDLVVENLELSNAVHHLLQRLMTQRTKLVNICMLYFCYRALSLKRTSCPKRLH